MLLCLVVESLSLNIYFLEETKIIRKMGLKKKMRGGIMGVSVVIQNSATVFCINKHFKNITTPYKESLEAIHFPNEFVCHKIYEIVHNQMFQLIEALMFINA